MRELRKTVQSLTLSSDGDTELAHLVFKDGSSVTLKGPRSGLTYSERVENDVTVYDCKFEGFELA